MKKFPQFIILKEFPFTIKKLQTAYEVKPKSKKGFLNVWLDKSDHSLHYVIAEQFLNFNRDTDKLKFKTRNKENADINDYKLENLEVVKGKDNYDMPVKGKVDAPILESAYDTVKRVPLNKSTNVINLDKDLLIDDIARKNYCIYEDDDERIFDINAIINDLREIFVFTSLPHIYHIKAYENEMRLIARKKAYLMEILSDTKIGIERRKVLTKYGVEIESNPISLASVFHLGFGPDSVRNMFMVRSIKFVSDDPRDFSFFRGYPWKVMHKNSTTTHSGVNSWLEHAKDIICNSNNDFYEFGLSSYAVSSMMFPISSWKFVFVQKRK